MISRRSFIKSLSFISIGLTSIPDVLAQLNKKDEIKPIEGSWFEFQHHNIAEGRYWNQVLSEFTAEQWDYKIKEIAMSGMRYLVLLNTAIDGKSFYPSKLLPQRVMRCDDPLETILSAADKYGVNFFVSNGFYGEWNNPSFLMRDKKVGKLRLNAMNEIAEKYAHHKSFYGWYYPNETGINRHFDEIFINYVNVSSKEAAKLTPNAKSLIAPYGTRSVLDDEKYVRQLENIDVDIIAYQDEVGVKKTAVEESSIFFERLYNLHKKAAKSRLWADVEIFKFEGEVYKSALLPAELERVVKQLKAVSPFVEKILIYQYIGMLNNHSTNSFAGHEDSINLYQGLKNQGYLK